MTEEEASGGDKEDWFKKEDAVNRDKWRDGVQAIAKAWGESGNLCKRGTLDKN